MAKRVTRLGGSHFTEPIRYMTLHFSPHVRKSKTVLDSGFHAVDSGFQEFRIRCRFRIPDSGFAVDSGFRTLSVEFGFQIPIVNGIRDPSSRIPDSKASDFATSRKSFPDSGFLKQWFLGLRNLDFLTWSDTFETVCMCEQKQYPVWFPGRRKSYPIRCEHIALYIKRKSKTVWDSGFHTVGSESQVLDCGFFISGTWIPDSNR